MTMNTSLGSPVKRNVPLILPLVSSSAGLQQFNVKIHQSECFLEGLQRWRTIEDSSWVGVHPVLDLLYLLGLDEGEVGPLGKKSSDDTVVVLICATFTRAVGMGEITIQSCFPW